jgi:hypothetical protein
MESIKLSDRFRDIERLKAEVANADIIFGVDTATGKASLFYGLARLKRIERRHAEEEAVVLRVPVNFAPDFGDLECLFVLVKAVKGACCYEGASN